MSRFTFVILVLLVLSLGVAGAQEGPVAGRANVFTTVGAGFSHVNQSGWVIRFVGPARQVRVRQIVGQVEVRRAANACAFTGRVIEARNGCQVYITSATPEITGTFTFQLRTIKQ